MYVTLISVQALGLLSLQTQSSVVNSGGGITQVIQQPYSLSTPNSPPPTSPQGPLSPLLSSHQSTASHTLNPNWQAAKSGIRERNAAMFNNDLMADVYFMVGPKDCSQRIPAHKYVLATGSTVFYAMFFGGLAEDKCNIEIPDVEPAAFLTLLR